MAFFLPPLLLRLQYPVQLSIICVRWFYCSDFVLLIMEKKKLTSPVLSSEEMAECCNMVFLEHLVSLSQCFDFGPLPAGNLQNPRNHPKYCTVQYWTRVDLSEEKGCSTCNGRFMEYKNFLSKPTNSLLWDSSVQKALMLVASRWLWLAWLPYCMLLWYTQQNSQIPKSIN